MKKLWKIVILVIVLCTGLVFVLDNTGLEKIDIEDGSLYGRLSKENSETVVLIVAGSGRTDMNGNTDNSKDRNDSLLQLSEELNKKGISTLRFDKRTAGKSANSVKKQMPEFDLFVSDCIAWIQYLEKLGYKKIYIAGHSQGSLVGMLAALEEPVDGFISLAGAGQSIDKVLIDQLSSKYDASSKEMEILKDLQNGEIDHTISGDSMFSPENQEFILSWMQYNPSEIIKKLEIPILIINGEDDLQVKTSEAFLLSDTLKGVEPVIISNMNHLLKEVNNEKENLASYSDPSYPVHEDVINEIVSFIN